MEFGLHCVLLVRYDDNSLVCTAINHCFCRSCRSEQVNIQERYVIIEELRNGFDN
jgi:hypothetical protein